MRLCIQLGRDKPLKTHLLCFTEDRHIWNAYVLGKLNMIGLDRVACQTPTQLVALAPVVVVEHLSKCFGQTVAVDDISFEVAVGATVGLLGGNGAGKTTTIAMLLGLMLPSAGRILVVGEDMLQNRYHALSRVNFASPYVDLPHRLTVRQNLGVYARLYSVPRPSSRITQIATDLQITELLDRRVGALSAGQKTRVTLAKALLNEPELLLLDEPTASLDPDTADRVRRYLERYRMKTGAAIVLASHNMGEVERLCSDVLMMHAGRIVDRGSPQALVSRHGRSNLEEVFLTISRGSRGDNTVDTK